MKGEGRSILFRGMDGKTDTFSFSILDKGFATVRLTFQRYFQLLAHCLAVFPMLFVALFFMLLSYVIELIELSVLPDSSVLPVPISLINSGVPPMFSLAAVFPGA